MAFEMKEYVGFEPTKAEIKKACGAKKQTTANNKVKKQTTKK